MMPFLRQHESGAVSLGILFLSTLLTFSALVGDAHRPKDTEDAVAEGDDLRVVRPFSNSKLISERTADLTNSSSRRNLKSSLLEIVQPEVPEPSEDPRLDYNRFSGYNRGLQTRIDDFYRKINNDSSNDSSLNIARNAYRGSEKYGLALDGLRKMIANFEKSVKKFRKATTEYHERGLRWVGDSYRHNFNENVRHVNLDAARRQPASEEAVQSFDSSDPTSGLQNEVESEDPDDAGEAGDEGAPEHPPTRQRTEDETPMDDQDEPAEDDAAEMQQSEDGDDEDDSEDEDNSPNGGNSSQGISGAPRTDDGRPEHKDATE
mmetsp:Transcript_127519/g.224711  ORF Transcript_127519/g.224711 Transcript_127519/m.224711 type:complete len:319 (-) Transcript_127519:125-1081(-)